MSVFSCSESEEEPRSDQSVSPPPPLQLTPRLTVTLTITAINYSVREPVTGVLVLLFFETSLGSNNCTRICSVISTLLWQFYNTPINYHLSFVLSKSKTVIKRLGTSWELWHRNTNLKINTAISSQNQYCWRQNAIQCCCKSLPIITLETVPNWKLGWILPLFHPRFAAVMKARKYI